MKVILALAVCGLVASKEYSVTLDPAEKFNVTWSFEEDLVNNATSENNSTNEITFNITVTTTGWIGLGFSPNGGMKNADIVMAWVEDDGTPHLLDMYAKANGAPVKDKSQDVTLVSATESNGVTRVVFKRSFNTSDCVADNLITSSTTRLIYAYGASDPADSNAPTEYHGSTNRGTKSLYLLSPPVQATPPPADALTFEMRVSNYQVPLDHTTYHCSFYHPPELSAKHHVVSIQTLLTPGNEALVHHIVLYGCWGLNNAHLRNDTKTSGICFTNEMPEFAGSCRSTLHAWAVGGGDFYYPEEAGFAIGGTDGIAPEYFMMEMHYDNPGYLNTWVDSSGLRLTYTPTLRKYDVGVLEMGMVMGIAVPPKPDKFRNTAYCDSSCTRQWVPAEGVELFAYALHTHLIGVAIQVDWYRNGKHIGILAYDYSYDFNFQESRFFDKNKKLMPDDTLKITCTYSDPNRIGVTYGGLPSSDEMCLAFIAYYPRQHVARCNSMPMMLRDSTDPVYNALGVNPDPFPWYHKITAFELVPEWNEKTISILQDEYDYSIHLTQCYKTSDTSYVNNFQAVNGSYYPPAKEVIDFCSEEETTDGDGDDKDKEKDKDKSGAAAVCSTNYLLVIIFITKWFAFY